MRTKYWILLFALLLGAAALFFLWGQGQKKEKAVAQIIQDGTVIREIVLGDVQEAWSFTVTDAQGHYNTLTVEPGRICISEADCPDKLCVHQGWLSRGITPIVCLPHKLMIQLTEGGQ